MDVRRLDNLGDLRLRWASVCAAVGLWCLPALTVATARPET